MRWWQDSFLDRKSLDAKEQQVCLKTPQRVSAISKMRTPDSAMQLMCVYRPSTKHHNSQHSLPSTDKPHFRALQMQGFDFNETWKTVPYTCMCEHTQQNITATEKEQTVQCTLIPWNWFPLLFCLDFIITTYMEAQHFLQVQAFVDWIILTWQLEEWKKRGIKIPLNSIHLI